MFGNNYGTGLGSFHSPRVALFRRSEVDKSFEFTNLVKYTITSST